MHFILKQWEAIDGFQAGNDMISFTSFKDLSGCVEKGLGEGAGCGLLIWLKAFKLSERINSILANIQQHARNAVFQKHV